MVKALFLYKGQLSRQGVVTRQEVGEAQRRAGEG